MRYRAEKRASRVSRIAAIGIGPLVEALVLLWLARLGLWLLPFKTGWSLMAAIGRARLRSVVRRNGGGAGRDAALRQSDVSIGILDPGHGLDYEPLVRAIAVAARIVPRATCLVKAQALHAMLARRHGQPTIGIGVAKGDDGRLEAHAWVELEGQVILGGQMPARYQPILYLSGEPI